MFWIENCPKNPNFAFVIPFSTPARLKNKMNQLAPNYAPFYPALGASDAKWVTGKKLIYN